MVVPGRGMAMGHYAAKIDQLLRPEEHHGVA